jgi:hypothetical protein
MTGDDGGLQGVKAARAVQLPRSRERLHPAPNLELVPERAVLFEQQNRFAQRVGACRRARRVQLHEGEQAMRLRLRRCDRGEHPAHPQCFVAERRSQPVLAAGRRIAFVENEV